MRLSHDRGAYLPFAITVSMISRNDQGRWGGLVATATHTGPRAKIGDTHHAVCEWSKANGYQLAGPRWEIYGDPDPSTGDFGVDVFWSLVAP
jgi:effector-binding domain-containing protein